MEDNKKSQELNEIDQQFIDMTNMNPDEVMKTYVDIALKSEYLNKVYDTVGDYEKAMAIVEQEGKGALK